MFDNYKLNMLNKKAASLESRPEKVLKSLNIHKGDIIGDIGTGGGYFTFEFSRKVGKNGRVYAIDTNQKSLAFIDDKSKKEMINNIKPVLADQNGLYLLETVDMFFLRNAFHHLPESIKYFKNIKQF
ncbi:methyltransferase domain-containing protein [Methanobacterium sp.]|uniref:methyltransferase domain-containing protein n=1 Tax=Methanobacterium sp. TaxID=2164 RepID=UPI003C773AD3